MKQPKRPRRPKPRPGSGKTTTHWGGVAEWYDSLVGDQGSDYQQHVVFPGILRLLAPKPGEKILDIACGQGAFCRILYERGVAPVGIDAAPQLIALARQRSNPAIVYHVGDVRKLDFIPPATFAAATCILAIQDIDTLPPVFSGVSRALTPGGRLIIAMTHPCFRGAKHTSWGWDDRQSIQYRRVDRYLLPRKEPIFTHPGQKTGQYTWSFHRPLQMYVRLLAGAGLLVDALEEWPGHKISTSGPRASAENAAREEIPMFLALRSVKIR